MKQKLEDPQETRQNILGEGVLFSFGCARCAGMVGVPFVKNCVVLLVNQILGPPPHRFYFV